MMCGCMAAEPMYECIDVWMYGESRWKAETFFPKWKEKIHKNIKKSPKIFAYYK